MEFDDISDDEEGENPLKAWTRSSANFGLILVSFDSGKLAPIRKLSGNCVTNLLRPKRCSLLRRRDNTVTLCHTRALRNPASSSVPNQQPRVDVIPTGGHLILCHRMAHKIHQIRDGAIIAQS